MENYGKLNLSIIELNKLRGNQWMPMDKDYHYSIKSLASTLSIDVVEVYF